MKRLVFVLAACVAAGRATPAAAQAGPDQTAKFVKTVENTNKGIREAREQVQKTVDIYNSIVDVTAKDNKGAYKDLVNNTGDCDKKVTNVGPRVDEMNAEATTYFGGWKASTASITDPGLKSKGEARLAESQARFNKIAAASKDARRDFDTLMTDLKNQSTFLGHDLNPDAIKSLKPDAVKFNSRATATLGKIDAVVKMNEEYATSMKP